MYVISGATGHTGKVAAQQLLAKGKKVRALVRDPAKAEDLAAAGAELVTVDLWDGPKLGEALEGASGLYLLSPPDMAAHDFIAERSRLLREVVKVVKGAQVPHVVLLSSVAAHQPRGTGIIESVHHAEVALRAEGIPSTFIRAGYFVENWAAVLPAAKQDGVLPSFIKGDQAIPQVSSADIGATAAQALLDGPRGERVLELSGPRDLSPKDVAVLVSKILGRPIQVVEPPIDAVVPTFTSFGISHNIASLYRDMYVGIRDGVVKFEGGKAERRYGTIDPETTLRQLLQ